MQGSTYIREGPLSISQEILLFGEVVTARPPTISRLVQVTGKIDVNAFYRAIARTISAHEPLRSEYAFGVNGAICKVKSDSDLWNGCTYYEPANNGKENIYAIVQSAYHWKGFAADCPPHMRHVLVRIEDEKYVWAFGAHHIAADALSLQHYASTFRECYVDPAAEIIRTSSIDYSIRQKRWFGTAEAQAHLEWWINQIRTWDTLGVTACAKPANSVSSKSRIEIRVPLRGGRPELLRRARKWRVPPAAILFAAFSRATERAPFWQEPIVLTNVAGRGLHGGSAATGAFYNTVPIPIVVGQGGLDQASLRAAQALFNAIDHQDVPMVLVNLGASRSGYSALASRLCVTFNVIEHPLSAWRMPGCRVDDLDPKTLDPLSDSKVSIRPIGVYDCQASEGTDYLATIMPSALSLAAEFWDQRADADNVRLLLEAFRDELAEFIDQERNGGPADLSLIADWSYE